MGLVDPLHSKRPSYLAPPPDAQRAPGSGQRWESHGESSSELDEYLAPPPDAQRTPGSGQRSESHGESSSELGEQDLSPQKSQCPAQVLAPERGGSLWVSIGPAPTDA